MRKFLFILLCITPGFVFAQENEAEKALTNFWTSAPMRHASFSFLLCDVQTGEQLLSVNPDRSIIPASTLKLLTTASAFEILGKDFRFETRLAYDGKLTNGKLAGNLIIVGGGDPALGSPRFGKFYLQPDFLSKFANAVKEAGITHIEGNLIADASLYGKYQTPGTWTWEDMGNYWGAQPNALSVFDNSYTAYFNSPKEVGKQTTISSLNHNELDITFKNFVVSSNSRYDNAYIFGAPFSDERYVIGDIPSNKMRYSVRGSIPDPAKLMGTVLMNKLQEAGITVSGKVLTRYEEKANRERTEFFTFPSPALQMVAMTTNMRSVNLYAEHMLRQIGISKMNSANLNIALSVVEEFWAEKGMNTSGMKLHDGSGLSHYNVITAKQMIFLLRHMATQSNNWFGFKNSLPVMGKSGTLKYMGRGTSIAGKIWAKSGSMSGIRAYAGYIKTAKGKDLCFFLAANHYSGKTYEIKQGIVDLLKVVVDKY